VGASVPDTPPVRCTLAMTTPVPATRANHSSAATTGADGDTDDGVFIGSGDEEDFAIDDEISDDEGEVFVPEAEDTASEDETEAVRAELDD
jgi:hypothetical protein